MRALLSAEFERRLELSTEGHDEQERINLNKRKAEENPYSKLVMSTLYKSISVTKISRKAVQDAVNLLTLKHKTRVMKQERDSNHSYNSHKPGCQALLITLAKPEVAFLITSPSEMKPYSPGSMPSLYLNERSDVIAQKKKKATVSLDQRTNLMPSQSFSSWVDIEKGGCL